MTYSPKADRAHQDNSVVAEKSTSGNSTEDCKRSFLLVSGHQLPAVLAQLRKLEAYPPPDFRRNPQSVLDSLSRALDPGPTRYSKQ